MRLLLVHFVSLVSLLDGAQKCAILEVTPDGIGVVQAEDRVDVRKLLGRKITLIGHLAAIGGMVGKSLDDIGK